MAGRLDGIERSRYLLQDQIAQDNRLSLPRRDNRREHRFRSTDSKTDNRAVTDSDADDIIVTDSESKTIYIKNFNETGKIRDKKQIDTTFHEGRR